MRCPGVMFYFSTRSCLKRLSLEEKGALFEAILDYGEFGVIPDFGDAVGVAVAWDFIQPMIDHDSDQYDAKVLQRRYAAYCREAKRAKDDVLPFDMWVQTFENEPDQPTSTDNNRYQPHPISITETISITDSVTETNKSTVPPAAEPAPASKPPDKEPKKKFGQYGWVKLTETEYSRLLDDLGQAELDRCVKYVDESAQGNGNKNKWKDWNLVIRRCHRDGWGLSAGKERKNYGQTASDSAAEAAARWNLPGIYL